MESSQDIWASFNSLDWAIIIVIAVSMMISLVRGFLREVISLATWATAVWVSLHYTDQVSVVLSGMITSPVLCTLMSIALLFFATLIAGVFLNVLIGGVMLRSKLSVADRFLGVAFGATRGILLVTLVTLVGSLSMFSEAIWWQQAELMPYFERNAAWIAQYLPERISHFVGNDAIVDEAMVRQALSREKVDTVIEVAASSDHSPQLAEGAQSNPETDS